MIFTLLCNMSVTLLSPPKLGTCILSTHMAHISLLHAYILNRYVWHVTASFSRENCRICQLHPANRITFRGLRGGLIWCNCNRKTSIWCSEGRLPAGLRPCWGCQHARAPTRDHPRYNAKWERDRFRWRFPREPEPKCRVSAECERLGHGCCHAQEAYRLCNACGVELRTGGHLCLSFALEALAGEFMQKLRFLLAWWRLRSWGAGWLICAWFVDVGLCVEDLPKS